MFVASELACIATLGSVNSNHTELSIWINVSTTCLANIVVISVVLLSSHVVMRTVLSSVLSPFQYSVICCVLLPGVCPPGRFVNETEGCSLCPMNTYTEMEGTMRNCTQCPNDTRTDSQGTNSMALCKCKSITAFFII